VPYPVATCPGSVLRLSDGQGLSRGRRVHDACRHKRGNKRRRGDPKRQPGLRYEGRTQRDCCEPSAESSSWAELDEQKRKIDWAATRLPETAAPEQNFECLCAPNACCGGCSVGEGLDASNTQCLETRFARCIGSLDGVGCNIQRPHDGSPACGSGVSQCVEGRWAAIDVPVQRPWLPQQAVSRGSQVPGHPVPSLESERLRFPHANCLAARRKNKLEIRHIPMAKPPQNPAPHKNGYRVLYQKGERLLFLASAVPVLPARFSSRARAPIASWRGPP
jgi:hypothetical protein